MIYEGKNINIELTNNSDDKIDIARSKGLSIVDTGDCEQLLKEKNILPQNEHLYSLNTNIKNSKYNNLNDTQYTLQSLYTSLVDSKGNSVNSSICSDFTIKLPTGNLLQNQSDYEYMKNLKGVDIYNKSEPFFTDVCITYPKNNSDIVLESRYELYPKQIECNAGCVYNGIDEHGYSLCKCNELPKEKAFNAGRDLIFKLFNFANYKLFKCIGNLFLAEITSVYGFFAVIFLTASYLIAFYIHSKFINVFDLTNNKPKVIMNDLLDVNILTGIFSPAPQLVGVPLDQVEKEINNANLPISNIIRTNVIEEEVNVNIERASVLPQSSIKKEFSSNNKNLKNTKTQPIHLQDKNVTRMINNFIGRVTKPVNNYSIKDEIRGVNVNVPINNNNTIAKDILNPSTSPAKYKNMSNINSIVFNSHLQNTPSEIQHPIRQVINSTLPYKNLAYTVAELSKAPLFVQLEIDERNSFTFYWHELKNGHEILNLFFYKSISTPFHIRLTILFISLSMRLCLSAMFFSDSYIKEQTGYKDKFGPEYTGWWYTFTNDILRILWPMLISVTLKNVMNVCILMSKEKLLEMNKFFAKESIKIEEAM